MRFLLLITGALASASALSLHAEICAGCAGGLAKAIALHPLDSITTSLEVARRDNTTRNTMRRLVRQPRLLYRGLGAVVAGVVPYAVVFHTFFWIAERVLLEFAAATELRAIVASAVASVAAVGVGVPFELLKHRAQAQGLVGLRAASVLRAARELIASDGWRSLYVGTRPTLWRNIPYNALHFSLYRAASRVPQLGDFAAGAVAGALTAIATQPVDTVNTRMQTNRVLRKDQYAGVASALRQITRDEGPLALWRGAAARVALYVPAAAIFFQVQQATLRLIP